jgi:uroporphyrinogen-III synthase
MKQQAHNVLITRPLSGQQREYAYSLELNPIERPALEFEFPSIWDDVLKAIIQHPESDWIFTSKNGVKALKKMMKSGLQIPNDLQVFAVGSKTQRELWNLGIETKIPYKQDGIHLAELIIEEKKNGSMIYFHGNLSRNEMTRKITVNGINVIEKEVYKTRIHPVEMPPKPVEAILFCSPSAVEGFKQGHGFNDPLPVLFAIGPVTAEALKNETGQSVKIAGKPDTKKLLQTVSSYIFQEQKETC